MANRPNREPRLTAVAKPASIQARNGQAPQALLVLGMHRSGTSAITRVFNLLGAAVPTNLLGANYSNERGHWESQDIIDIHDELLLTAGSRWDDWRVFNPEWIRSGVSESHKKALLEILQRDFGGSHLFVLKDPRICRFVPVWLEVLERFHAAPHVVIPIRNPLEVAASLKRRNEFASASSYLLWLRHVLDAERTTRHLPRAIMSYGDLLEDWRSVVATVSSKTGIHWPRRSDRTELEIDHFLAETMRHHESNVEQLSIRADIADWVKEAYFVLLQMANGRESKDHYKRLDRIYAAFDMASATFGRVLAGETESMEAQLRTRDAQIKAKDEEVIRLSEQLIQAQIAADEAQSATNEAQIKLAGAQTANQSTIQQRDREVIRLTHDVETARTFLRESQAQVQRLAGELDHAQREIERTEGERRRISEELVMVREKSRYDAAQTTRRIDELSRDLQFTKGQFGALETELTRLKSELASREKLALDLAGRQRITQAMTEGLRAALVEQVRVAAAAAEPRQDDKITLWQRIAKHIWPPQFDRKAARAWEYEIIRKSDLFDTQWYATQYPDVAAAGADPLWHYVLYGADEGRSPHPMFEPGWYQQQLHQNADMKIATLTHYVTIGMFAGLDPGPLFDHNFYLQGTPNLAATQGNALLHYLTYGAYEGRDPHPLFDSSWYLERSPDVIVTRDNPVLHYLAHGWKSGRDPHPDFDTSWYLEQYPEIAAAGTNPLLHYLQTGWAEGRDPNPDFDSDWYLENYPDVREAGVNPLVHYVLFGRAEGRATRG